MIKNLLLMIVALGLLFGGIFGWKHFQSSGNQGFSGRPPVVISTQIVRQEQWQPSLPSVGSLVPTKGVRVSSEVSGMVREINFDSGQRVNAGDLLVQLDIEVDTAETAALEAERQLAEVTRDRLQSIVAKNVGSRSDLDEAVAHLDKLRADVMAKEATLRKKSIRAPFAGELGIRQVNPGQFLASGEPIVDLMSFDPIFAEYSLPERFLGEIRVDQPVVVSVAAWPDLEFVGAIQAISPSVEQSTRSVRIRAIFENPEGRLRPGMFAELRTLLPEKSGILTLPERAITYNPYGNSVFVAADGEGGKTVRRIQVTTGNVTDGRIEILTGLEPGMEVVTDGHNKLRNGQNVTVDNSSLPTENGSQ